MKPIIRTTVGLASCFLAAAGMMRAAERIDPLAHALIGTDQSNRFEAPGEACATPCQYVGRAETAKAMEGSGAILSC